MFVPTEKTDPLGGPVMVTTGFGLVTVTVKPQLLVLPEASVAVHETEVVPIGNWDPEGGLHATVTPGQLSLADAEYDTTA